MASPNEIAAIAAFDLQHNLNTGDRHMLAKEYRVNLSFARNVGRLYHTTDRRVLNQWVENLNIPLEPAITHLKIYYPISIDYNAVTPISQEYNTETPITGRDIFNFISTFYDQPIPAGTVAYYVQLNSDDYGWLPLESNPKIKDLISPDMTFGGIKPHQDGFLVNLLF